MFLASNEAHILIYQRMGIKVFGRVLWRGGDLGLVPRIGDLFQELYTREGERITHGIQIAKLCEGK
jgi:hypothetical protein